MQQSILKLGSGESSTWKQCDFLKKNNALMNPAGSFLLCVFQRAFPKYTLDDLFEGLLDRTPNSLGQPNGLCAFFLLLQSFAPLSWNSTALTLTHHPTPKTHNYRSFSVFARLSFRQGFSPKFSGIDESVLAVTSPAHFRHLRSHVLNIPLDLRTYHQVVFNLPKQINGS